MSFWLKKEEDIVPTVFDNYIMKFRKRISSKMQGKQVIPRLHIIILFRGF